MSAHRPLRFGGGGGATATAAEFADNARRIESLGYSTLLTPDHFEREWFAVGPALVAAASATTTLRVGSSVYCNNFRHPAVLAREAATVDVLTDGRLEFGLGAGYYLPEYDHTGIFLPPRGERVTRLRETLRIVHGLWSDGPFTFSGRHYTISDMDGWPKPVQKPRPPIHVGGGGKQVLTLAAQQADIVGIIAQSADVGLHFERDTHALLAEKVEWVREAAGSRFDQIELAALIWGVKLSDHRQTAAEELARRWGLPVNQVLDSPYFLIGSPDAIVEQVLALREQYSISYLNIFPDDVTAFAPVVNALTGA
jgi:probable F420-dependent oxidoreductase